jgi:hypothetical protein
VCDNDDIPESFLTAELLKFVKILLQDTTHAQVRQVVDVNYAMQFFWS